jgi:hypothetical protein
MRPTWPKFWAMVSNAIQRIRLHQTTAESTILFWEGGSHDTNGDGSFAVKKHAES